MDREHISVDIETISARELYDLICANMSFNRVIELYRLLQHKMTNLDDEPVYTISSIYRNEEE